MLNGTAMSFSLITSFHNNANISMFQHDNATSHTTRNTAIFLGQIALISLMTGPLTVLISTPSSMSGIVWTDDGGGVPTHPLTSMNIFQRSFGNGTIINTLVNSMRRRCTAVVSSRGGHTRGYFLVCFFLTPTTLGKNVSQFLLTYGHDFCTKR